MHVYLIYEIQQRNHHEIYVELSLQTQKQINLNMIQNLKQK